MARAGAGPRGVPEPASEVDSCANIILLCPTHHRIVDAQPDIYTAKVLRAMKYQHETAVRARQRSTLQLAIVHAPAYEVLCHGGLRAAGAWRYGPSLVIACSFGSDPVLTDQGHWRGAGLEFRHIHDYQGSELIFTSSEAEPDVDYRVADSVLKIIQATYEPQTNTITPFVEHSFELGQFPAARSLRLLLALSLGYGEDLHAIVEQLTNLPHSSSANAEELLYRIRNIGLSEPDVALAAIERLRGLWWYDGVNAETAQAICGELYLVKRATDRAA